MARRSNGGKPDNLEDTLHDQTQLLDKKNIVFVFALLSLCLLVCFIDQNGIGVILPPIARDLNAESSISWAGTSALIANTVFQVLYGRLSDLFGRKNILVSALVLLSLSDLACGLSVNSTMLYIFRGLAGVANGGITSLTMMIVSDIVTLQDRGKYQGILGSMVGLGNAIGPLIASAFAIHATWRGLFYLLAPLIMIVVALSWLYLPTNMPELDWKETLGKIDFLGLCTGTAAVILILIPISEGGHDGTPWDSAEVIAMLVVGGVCFVAFLLVEWRWARLPIMPLDMFNIPSVAAMLAQSFFLGASYYSYLYFLPLYYQNVKGYTPLVSAALLLPIVVTQAISSTLAGLSMSRWNRYGIIIWGGFSVWLVGSGLLIMADRTLHVGWLSFFLFLMGTGTGMVFQPTLVALQAHTPKMQRAVVTSNRNFLRSSGGAVGLAVSSAILANTLRSSLPERLADVANSTFAAPDLSTFDEADRVVIADAYASASRAVFIFCTPLTALCLALCVLVKDHGLVREEETPGATTPAVVEEEDVEKSSDASRRASKESVRGLQGRGVLRGGEKDGAGYNRDNEDGDTKSRGLRND
ncbi:hypothetical protein Q7P37_010483 [Cladosporium fusiforme]